ncbi:MAG: glycosyltransferase family 2 protein [Thermoanaerobaculia bacterium]
MKQREAKSDESIEALRATPGRLMLSVVITTYNEEVNIADCLRSVLWADEILVVDSFSSDRTLEYAREFPVQILEREYFGSAAQKNWSLDKIRYDWVLILDADERVTKPLAREILKLLIDGPTAKGYYLRRQNIVLGKAIRHSGWSTDKVIRLFDKAHGRYPNRRVHADLDIEPPTPTLRYPLDHFTYRSVQQYFEKFLNYAEWGAAQGYREGKKAGFLEIGGRPTWRFFRTYFLQGGFLDGLHGLVVCGLQAFGVFLKYSWLWEHRVKESLGEEVALPAFDDDSATWERPPGSTNGDPD